MIVLPEVARQGWEDREGPIVLTTVDSAGNPNAIYATCVSSYGEDRLIIADNFFSKTRVNILARSKASLLFITKDGRSFQLKGTIELHDDGALYDDMKRWNPVHLPGRAAAVLTVEHVFSGADKLA